MSFAALVVLLVVGLLVWALVLAPARELARLRARADAGDADARAALVAREETRLALDRAGGRPDPEHARISRSGLDGRARIVAVRPQGFRIKRGGDTRRLIEVDLTCSAEGRAPWSVTTRDLVSEMHLGRLLIGASLPIKVDPAPPHRVVVLWDVA